jgi:hypothetical protein
MAWIYRTAMAHKYQKAHGVVHALRYGKQDGVLKRWTMPLFVALCSYTSVFQTTACTPQKAQKLLQ